jgi:hypothetical protein
MGARLDSFIRLLERFNTILFHQPKERPRIDDIATVAHFSS